VCCAKRMYRCHLRNDCARKDGKGSNQDGRQLNRQDIGKDGTELGTSTGGFGRVGVGRIGGIVGTAPCRKDTQVVDGPVRLIVGAAIVPHLIGTRRILSIAARGIVLSSGWNQRRDCSR
jgi:hypothetical protein